MKSFHGILDRTVSGLCIIAALFGGARFCGATTIGTSSYLQVNLSFMPFSYYDTSHSATSYGFSTSCPSGANVRSCFQTILGNMAAQYVSGVRIFVTLCDSTSQAFSNCGDPYTSISWDPGTNSYQQTWITNVTNFFHDVYAAGISNVTITMADGPPVYTKDIADTSSPKGACGTSDNFCCSDTQSTVYFSATEPFGSSRQGTYPSYYYLPIGNYWAPAGNDGYNCAPKNPYFIGWTNEFNAINAILAAASGEGLTVYELEGEQELNLASFTTLARYIYDNSSPESAGLGTSDIVDVVSNLRSLMTANGFDSGRVNWSSTGTDAYTATANCANIYTDYSRNYGPDEVATAINGGYIGLPNDWSVSDGLVCDGDAASIATVMTALPLYNSQPDIVDVHIYPQVKLATNTDSDIQTVAAIDFGDLPHFLTLASLTSAEIVVGETWGGTLDPGYSPNGGYCWVGDYLMPSGTPNDNVAGFNDEGISSPLSDYTVTFRPWMELEDPSGECFAYSTGPSSASNYQNVNYSNSGPYTPTSH